MNIFYIFSLKLSNVFWMSVLSMAKTIDRLFFNKSIQSFDALFIYIQIQIMFLSLASGLSLIWCYARPIQLKNQLL